ncbi:MAG TPA: TetR/AcrR family transcriptional regulator [Steroidobacteraceae bacterium]|nr:TetR/AcrR family transcriptional regulator [Steroidobacteraceae bacterium]
MNSTPQQKHRGRGAASRRPRPLGREIWLDTARRALIEEGTAGLEINKLAKRLRSSRGGFYWFFKSRAQLIDELLDYWAKTSTVPFERIVQAPGTWLEKYRALVRLWIDEDEYDPKWDGAVRDWARTSESVHAVVAAVDQKRITLLEQIYVEMGYKGKEANVRARITYYHQVGYYAMEVHESRRERLALLPYYMKVLTGRDGT